MDEKLAPWLIEVNHAPSFTTDTPFDYKVKYQILDDTFQLLNFSAKRKHIYKNKKRAEMQTRVFTGKLNAKVSPEQREKMFNRRCKYEAKNVGGYKLIYPDPVSLV